MRIFLFSFFLIAIAMGNHAQVTIGSGITPPVGALLNLQEHDACSKNTTSNKGLLLPRVGLTTLTSMKDIKQGRIENAEEHSGLVVFNINDYNESCLTLPSGLYLWNGARWVNLAGQETREMSGSYTEDVLVLKRIMTENKSVMLDWVIDESDPSNPKFIKGTGVHFTQNACDDFRLTKLELSNKASLISLNVSGATALEELICYNNSSLKNIEISNNPVLSRFECSNNSALTSLSLVKVTSLTELNCYNNPALASLDVSGLALLTELRCYNNPSLILLNIDGANNLAYIDCYNTSLAYLDVSNANALKFLRCDTKTLDKIKVTIDEAHKGIELIPNVMSSIYNWI